MRPRLIGNEYAVQNVPSTGRNIVSKLRTIFNPLHSALCFQHTHWRYLVGMQDHASSALCPSTVPVQEKSPPTVRGCLSLVVEERTDFWLTMHISNRPNERRNEKCPIKNRRSRAGQLTSNDAESHILLVKAFRCLCKNMMLPIINTKWHELS
jgi:hypothetical protein